jgi:pseudaminic acid synthase
MSGNHGHDFSRAVRLVEEASRAGADAIKLQTYTPDTLTIPCDNRFFRIEGGTLWDGKTLHELYGEAYTPWEWHAPLQKVAEGVGLDFFSTPFDSSAVDFLVELDVPVYKIASFEMVDPELISKVASTGKPMIISTGMSSELEIEEALAAARSGGRGEVAVLKCTSAYPAPPEEINLRAMQELALRFDVVAGLSDHTLGTTVPVAAVALGAGIIEKHFTLSRDEPGPDNAFSLEPAEFAEMVRSVRVAEKALGAPTLGVSEAEGKSKVFRRSLFVVEDVKAGDAFTSDNVRSIRPGHGLAPKHLREVLGRRATRDVTRGTPLGWELVV